MIAPGVWRPNQVSSMPSPMGLGGLAKDAAAAQHLLASIEDRGLTRRHRSEAGLGLDDRPGAAIAVLAGKSDPYRNGVGAIPDPDIGVELVGRRRPRHEAEPTDLEALPPKGRPGAHRHNR